MNTFPKTDRYISPWRYPAVCLILQILVAILSTATRFSGQGSGQPLAFIADFFLWELAFTSNYFFPCGFTIAATLAWRQSRINRGLATGVGQSILHACVAALLSTLGSFVLFAVFAHFSSYAQRVGSGAGLGAIVFLFAPLLSGLLGFCIAALICSAMARRS